MEAWNAQSILLVWFTQTSSSVTASAVFETVFGREADTTQSNKSPNPAAPFYSVAARASDGIQSQVAVLPGRIDVSIIAVPASLESGTEIADTPGRLADLLKAAESVSNVVPQVYRQALVLSLQRKAANANEALDYLDVKLDGIDLQGTIDFSLQLNKRKTLATVHDCEMNRLLRVATVVAQQVNLTIGNGVPAAPVNFGEEVVFSSFMIDLNTVSAGRQFEPAEQISVWREFAEEALRLRNAGNLKALQS